MDTNLISQDMNCFLDKYTRFMTKNIYITTSMYHCFLEQYQYLYDVLEKNYFLYNDNIQYKKIMKILQNKNRLIKLHNQKYLKTALKEYEFYFKSFSFNDKLDQRKRMIILTEEDNIFTIQSSHIISLILGKIKFLEIQKKYLSNQVLILTTSREEKVQIQENLDKESLNTSVQFIKEYGIKLLNNDEKILEYNEKYDILSNYLIYELFPKKDLFNSFYEAFSKVIYLNKDYQDFETFHDYHNYMYKRKFLSSKLTLKKFNEQEVKKRSTHLRTIKNEIMKQKEEVDIANFLYLNSIPYCYDMNDSIFIIQLDEKYNQIKFLNEQESLEKKNASMKETIYLYSSYIEKKTYLEVLAYELIKRRYPLELVSDDNLYKKLKDTTIENYFSELIHKYLIPTIDYYEKNQTLENTTLTINQQKEFYKLYQDYDNSLKKSHYIKEKELLTRIEQDIKAKKYKYLILIGDISLACHIPTMTIVSNYQENTLLKENIKLFYDYKKYLYSNQSLPIPHTYLSRQELKSLTTSFLKDNLAIINKSLEENTKPIKIYYYEDNHRLHIYQNISKCCDKIIEQNSKNLLIAFRQLKDMNILIQNNLFMKHDKITLLTNRHEKIPCEEISNISKLYDTIILPNLITDNFHEDFLNKDYLYYLKVMLYITINKCKTNLIILCPNSRKQELDQLLCNLKNPVYSE